MEELVMQEILLFASLISPIILGFVELIKKTVKFPNNYVPVVAIFVGLVVAFAAGTFSDLDIQLRLWAGALSALAATGLFELVTKSNGYTKK